MLGLLIEEFECHSEGGGWRVSGGVDSELLVVQAEVEEGGGGDCAVAQAKTPKNSYHGFF